MINILHKKDCCGCGACLNICPRNCISLETDEEGFLYPHIDKNSCINCNLCTNTCPIINSVKDTAKNQSKIYGAFCKNEKIQLQSSSGGIFYLLAENIINNNGVVYGAGFNNNYEVEHMRIDNINNIIKLQTSKYIQSNIGTTYQQVKTDLINNKLVLFTGTSCQVSGLKAYLNKNYNNLITQDFICHGVPSAKVWKKYLKYTKLNNISTVNFRDKCSGWNEYSLTLKSNYKTISEIHNHNLYMISFLSNNNLRPSCYDCKFKKINRSSDITLADFWGANEVHPEIFSNKGTSAIFIHTQKASVLFNNIKKNLKYIELSFDDVLKYNKSYLYSVKEPESRIAFFKNLDRLKFNKLVKKYCLKKIKHKHLKNFLHLIKKIKNKIKGAAK